MICSFQENAKYRKFCDSPMENLDELEVMFQHINVTGASSVIPRGCLSQHSIDVDDDSYEAEEDVTDAANKNEKKKGKRKVENVVPGGKKKARNPMVRQVSRLIDVLSTGKQKKEQRAEADIIEQIEQAVNAGAYEGSDEHFMATKALC
jgi:hypothetical protein